MLKAAASVALAVATVVYPLVVFYGLTRWGLGRVSVFVAASAAVVIAVRWRRSGASSAHSGVAAFAPPAVLFAGATVGWWIREPRVLLFLPVAINAALLVTFAQSLRGPMPLIERYARLLHADLSPDEARHCRQVTKIWCGFFFINGAIAAGLAWMAPITWWAAYTGIGAYVAMGVLFAAEYVVRKKRFGRFGRTLADRLLAQVLLSKGKS